MRQDPSRVRAARGSLSIEGYHTSVESAAAIIDGEEPAEVSDETRQAIAGYREAMTCVLQIAPGAPDINVSLLLSLHFMMMQYDFSKHPGRWRPGAVWVRRGSGEVVYEAPDRELVEPLVEEALAQLTHSEAAPAVTAAMAHLNLTLIHPFSDGNGRMARCLQTLVLTAAGEGAPQFVSIEEYLGANTAAYYAVLTEVAQGTWSPQNSALPWIEFCLTAHYRQALTVLRRIRELEALWDGCEQITRRHRLSPRTVGALVDAARGWRLRRSLYVSITKATAGEDISDAVATSDLGGDGTSRVAAPCRAEARALLRTDRRADEPVAGHPEPATAGGRRRSLRDRPSRTLCRAAPARPGRRSEYDSNVSAVDFRPTGRPCRQC